MNKFKLNWHFLQKSLLQDVSTTGQKFAALDGMRGFAVLIVFLSHTSGRNQSVSPYLNFLGIGHLGVYIFFVLSSFLLTLSLLNRPQISIPEFYIRRLFRICPLYYLVIFGVFTYQAVTHSLSEKYLYISEGIDGLIKHFLYVQGDSVFWTIAVEFQFYLILPFIILFILRYKKLAVYTISTLAVIYFLKYVEIVYGEANAQRGLSWVDISHDSQFLDIFWCGIVSALVYKSDRFKFWYQQHQKRIELTVTFLFISTILISLVAIALQFLIFSRVAYDIRYLSLPYGIVISIILLATMCGHDLLNRIFNLNFLRTIGIIGFGWYLLHFPVLQIVNVLAERLNFDYSPLKFCMSFILCYAVSTVAYLYVEKPFMVMSKAYANRRLRA